MWCVVPEQNPCVISLWLSSCSQSCEALAQPSLWKQDVVFQKAVVVKVLHWVLPERSQSVLLCFHVPDPQGKQKVEHWSLTAGADQTFTSRGLGWQQQHELWWCQTHFRKQESLSIWILPSLFHPSLPWPLRKHCWDPYSCRIATESGVSCTAF